MAILTRFWTRPADDRSLLARVAVVYALAAIGLRLAPFRAVRRVLDAVARTPVARSSDTEPRVVWAVRTVAALWPASPAMFIWPRPACLTDALAAKVFLTPEYELHIGVAGRPAHGEPLRAHAWVEREGRTIVGAATPVTYHRLGRVTAA